MICFANVGYSPTPRQHFWKTAAPKNFQLPAARGWQSWFLGKMVFHVRQKGFHPCFCLPACYNCPVALSEFVTCFIRAANSELGSFKNCNCSRKNRLQNQFAPQMWATRPHLASIFEKLLDQKTFCLPAARGWQSWFLGKTVFHVRQKGVPPLLLPANVLQLPRCLVRICNLFHKSS